MPNQTQMRALYLTNQQVTTDRVSVQHILQSLQIGQFGTAGRTDALRNHIESM